MKALSWLYLLPIEQDMGDASVPTQLPRSPRPYLSFGLDPYATFVHQVDLLLNDLLSVLVVLHGFPVKVEVFGINGLFVKHLIEFGA